MPPPAVAEPPPPVLPAFEPPGPPYQRPYPMHSAPHPPMDVGPFIPRTPATARVIEQVFGLCRNDWVREFLFTTDPVQATVLTSLNAAFAVNTVFREDYVTPTRINTLPHPAVADGAAVLVPAFSEGPITAGVAIKQRRVADPDEATGLVPFHGGFTLDHVRYVGDATSGTYLCVRANGRSPVFYVEAFVLTSPTHRTRTTLTLFTDKILKAMNHDKVVSAATIYPALAMVQVIHESRECQACGTALQPTCRCAPPSKHIPSHALDFETMKANLLSHFGAFQGVEVLNMYTERAHFASGRLGTRFSISFSDDDQVKNKLIRWAINDCIQSSKPNPLRQLLPTSGNRDDEVLYGYFGDLDVVDEPQDRGEKPGTASPPHDADEAAAQAFVVGAAARAGMPGYAVAEPERVAPSTSPERTPSPNAEVSGIEKVTTASDEASRESPESVGRGEQTESTSEEQVRSVPKEKLSKAQMRREKNRQAAKRSNLNKKRQNDRLREQLRADTARMEALSVKEAALRVENSRLRKLVAEHAAS